MKKTQLYLTEEQWRDLLVRSRQEDVSVAELVRRAVDQVYRAKSDNFAVVLKRVTGLWADKPGLDSAAYVRELRDSDRT